MQPRSLPDGLVQGRAVVGLMVLNCWGKVRAMRALRVTGVGLGMKLKLTGSYCRLRVKVYWAFRLISVLLVLTVMPMKAP